MNNKNDLELFYISPYERKYYDGFHYMNDETCCIDYKQSFMGIWNFQPLTFDESEQLLQWFYKNADKPIPTVYRIKYITEYMGMSDVIKTTNLSSGKTIYSTILNKDMYAWYDSENSELSGKKLWKSDYLSNNSIDLKFIYDEYVKRGIKIECDVFKRNFDKTKFFEFIGDPFCSTDREKMKEMQLVLYKSHPSNRW